MRSFNRHLTFKHLLTAVIFLALILGNLTAAASQPDTADESDPIPFFYYGFVEWTTFINTYPDQDFSDAFKKHEIRNHLEARWGEDSLYLFLGSDIYAQPNFWQDDADKDYRYTSDSGVKRNLRMTATDYEIAFNELYLNLQMRQYRIRIGNQLYNWGTADGINPTDYFNPYDLREFIFRDDDEFQLGTPSVSGMYFGEVVTVEMVFAPFHVPMMLAPHGNFWSLRQDDALYAIRFEETDGMPIELKNFGYGVRGSVSMMGMDMSLSAYHGPDREPILVPISVQVRPDLPLSVLIGQQYEVVDMFGIDASKSVGDFVFQCEVAYAPNKSNIVEQNTSFDQIRLPFDIESSHYISYAIGFNYFIPLHQLLEGHEGESVLTFEWFQSKFFEKGVSQPYLFTDLLSFEYEDTFLGGRLPVSVKTVIDTRSGSSVFWPEIGWDFQNGLTCELFYAGINGRSDDSALVKNSFYFYRNNDIVGLNVRYRY